MTDPPWSSDVDKFLAVLLASYLLDSHGFGQACSHASRTKRDHKALDELCSHLIDDGMLTQWQCEKLRAGKFKGFYFEGYCLLEEVETTESEKIMVARDLEQGIKVELAIQKPLHGSRHRVLRVLEDED